MPTSHANPPTPARYTVHPGLLWLKAEVVYACPSCGEVLRSKLHEANTVDQCPACAARFRVPGRPEYRATRRRDLERARARRDRLRRRHERHRASSADGLGLRGRILRFTTRRTQSGTRTYPMLLIVAMALRLLGVTSLVSGPIALAVLIYYDMPLFGALAVSVGAALCLLLLTFAELILAVRDIASNSWHIRRRVEQNEKPPDQPGGSS